MKKQISFFLLIYNFFVKKNYFIGIYTSVMSCSKQDYSHLLRSDEDAQIKVRPTDLLQTPAIL